MEVYEMSSVIVKRVGVCVYQLPLGERMLALDCYTSQRWGPLVCGASMTPPIHPQVT